MHSTKVLTSYAAPEQAILDGIDEVLDAGGICAMAIWKS
jgi:hypothetical protein